MRKPIGILVLCTYIALYIAVAATLGGMLTTAPVWLQLGYFAVAGILWVFPLKPLFAWMNSPPKPRNAPAD